MYRAASNFPDMVMSKRGFVFLAAIVTAGVAVHYTQNILNRPPQPAAIISESAPKVAMVGVLVAATDIPFGKRIAENDFQWQQWPLSGVNPKFIQQTTGQASMAALVGSVARSAFIKGEPISDQKISKKNGGYMASLLEPGTRAVSIEILPNTSVNGFAVPGDHVDVVLTSAEKRFGGDFYTGGVVLQDVKLLAIDDKIDAGNENTVSGKLATLALSTDQAQTLTIAQRLGTLSLLLRSVEDAEQSSSKHAACDTRIGERQGVTVIKYGMESSQVTSRPLC